MRESMDTMKNAKVRWITQTAVLLALLIAVQAATARLNNTYITGSIVNLLLVLSVTLCGLSSGIALAVISPLFAFLLGIGPAMIQIVPCIMLGNAVLVIIWYFVGNLKIGSVHSGSTAAAYLPFVIAWIAAAVIKFLVLYISVAKVVLPMLMESTDPRFNKLSTMFSFPQLVTAGIGGFIAIFLIRRLREAVKYKD